MKEKYRSVKCSLFYWVTWFLFIFGFMNASLTFSYFVHMDICPVRFIPLPVHLFSPYSSWLENLLPGCFCSYRPNRNALHHSEFSELWMICLQIYIFLCFSCHMGHVSVCESSVLVWERKDPLHQFLPQTFPWDPAWFTLVHFSGHDSLLQKYDKYFWWGRNFLLGTFGISAFVIGCFLLSSV